MGLSEVRAADDSAEVRESHLPPWAVGTGLVGGILGGPTFAVWFSWYMTTRRIPLMEKRNLEERQRQEDRYDAERKVTEERHAAHLQVLMKNHREDLQTWWATKRDDEIKARQERREDDLRLEGVLKELTTAMQQLKFDHGTASHGSQRQSA